MLLHREYEVSPNIPPPEACFPTQQSEPGGWLSPLQQCFIEGVHFLRRVVFLSGRLYVSVSMFSR